MSTGRPALCVTRRRVFWRRYQPTQLRQRTDINTRSSGLSRWWGGRRPRASPSRRIARVLGCMRCRWCRWCRCWVVVIADGGGGGRRWLALRRPDPLPVLAPVHARDRDADAYRLGHCVAVTLVHVADERSAIAQIPHWALKFPCGFGMTITLSLPPLRLSAISLQTTSLPVDYLPPPAQAAAERAPSRRKPTRETDYHTNRRTMGRTGGKVPKGGLGGSLIKTQRKTSAVHTTDIQSRCVCSLARVCWSSECTHYDTQQTDGLCGVLRAVVCGYSFAALMNAQCRATCVCSRRRRRVGGAGVVPGGLLAGALPDPTRCWFSRMLMRFSFFSWCVTG